MTADSADFAAFTHTANAAASGAELLLLNTASGQNDIHALSQTQQLSMETVKEHDTRQHVACCFCTSMNSASNSTHYFAN